MSDPRLTKRLLLAIANALETSIWNEPEEDNEEVRAMYDAKLWAQAQLEKRGIKASEDS